MARITTTYSHAAPYIRAQALRSAQSATNAKTKRDKREFMGQLFAYVTALDILLHSPEGQNSPPGIADFETIPRGWEELIERFLDGRKDLFPTLQKG